MTGAPEQVLPRVLEHARSVGFLGAGPVEAHISHAERFLSALESRPIPGSVVDLGAGGGVPSLPMLSFDASLEMVLVDAAQKRCAFLVWATVELGVSDRVEVWCGRAEEFGHDRERRGRFSAVVARSFGPPASTLECAAPLLVPGGRCVVSEPPEHRAWPVDGVARAGLEEISVGSGVAVFERQAVVPAEFPRPWKVQQQRPLFELDETMRG